MHPEPPFWASRVTCLGHVSKEGHMGLYAGAAGLCSASPRNLGALGSASAGLKPEGCTGTLRHLLTQGPQRASRTSPRVTRWTRVGAGGARSRENPYVVILSQLRCRKTLKCWLCSGEEEGAPAKCPEEVEEERQTSKGAFSLCPRGC